MITILDDGRTGEAVVAFELKGYRIAIWKCSDKSWVITDTYSQKSLLCLSFEQATEIMEGCVQHLKMAEA